jgi:hypothetical protein
MTGDVYFVVEGLIDVAKKQLFGGFGSDEVGYA